MPKLRPQKYLPRSPNLIPWAKFLSVTLLLASICFMMATGEKILSQKFCDVTTSVVGGPSTKHIPNLLSKCSYFSSHFYIINAYLPIFLTSCRISCWNMTRWQIERPHLICGSMDWCRFLIILFSWMTGKL